MHIKTSLALGLALTIATAGVTYAQMAPQPDGQRGAAGTGTSNTPVESGYDGSGGGGTIRRGTTGSSQPLENQGQEGASGTGTTLTPEAAGAYGSAGGGTERGGRDSVYGR